MTDTVSISTAASAVAGAVGADGLSGLVNNAGIVVPGPIEFLPLPELRRQLEINVVGQVAVTQAFLPLIRTGRGRIVNMGSISGRMATPFTGAYGASKFALEALTDALRLELAPWGISVSIIEPGAVATPIWDKVEAIDSSRAASTPYGPALAVVKDFSIAMGRRGFPPEKIGGVVLKALTAAKPRTRYTVTPDALRFRLMMALPKRMVDRLIAKRLGFTVRGVAKHAPRQG